jgi:glutaredoxin
MTASFSTGISIADKEAVAARRDALPESIRIGLAASKDSLGEAFSAFCEELKTLIPQLTVKKEDLRADGLPFLKISDRIRYHCIPREKELPPFLDLLAGADFPPPAMNSPSVDRIAAVSVTAFVKIYVAPLCPFCPKTVADLFWLAGQSRFIHITIIDGELFPALAQQDRIRSVPTVILDNDLRWVGQVDLDEIVGMAVERDPSKLGPDALRSMIEEGGAGDLAGMMTGQEKIFPAIVDLLTHSQWSVRLGAMAVFEYLVENSPGLADQLLDLLWERFEGTDDQVKGDMLYLMGQARHSETPARLEAVIAGPYAEDVKEAAREALETFRGDA